MVVNTRIVETMIEDMRTETIIDKTTLIDILTEFKHFYLKNNRDRGDRQGYGNNRQGGNRNYDNKGEGQADRYGKQRGDRRGQGQGEPKPNQHATEHLARVLRSGRRTTASTATVQHTLR